MENHSFVKGEFKRLAVIEFHLTKSTFYLQFHVTWQKQDDIILTHHLAESPKHLCLLYLILTMLCAVVSGSRMCIS